MASINENDIKNFIIDKFKEIEDYNNNLKDWMINDLYNYDNKLSYSELRDKISDKIYEITRVVSDFKSLNEKMKK